MSETPVVNQIQHYQRSIEKYPDDEQRVLRCIRKLDELKVTVQHLQVTGVGRTVNALRKYDGTVGNASKALVSKWKIMVVDEGSSDYDDDDDNCAPDVSGGYSDNSDSGVDKDENHIPTSSGHKSSESRERHSNSNSRNESRSSKNSPNNSSELSRSKSTSRSNGNSDDNRYHSKSSLSNHQNKSEDSNTRLESREKKSKSSRESSGKSDKHRDSSKRDESVNHSSNSNISSSSKIKKDKESKVSSNEYAKHNGSSSDRKRKHDGLANEKNEHKRRRSGELVDESEEDNKSLDDTNEINNEISDSEYDKIQMKSESPEPRRNSSKEVAVKKDKSKDKAAVAAAVTDGVDKVKEEKHKHSSSSSKYKVKSDSKSSENRKHDKKKDESSSKLRTSNDSSSSRDTADKNKHGEKSKDKKSEKDKDKSKDKDKDKKHKEKKIKINGKEGIDCNSGTSFAEALGMCTASTSFSRKKIVSPNISKSTKSEASTSSQKSSKIKTEPSSPKEEQPLSLLSPSIKLEPLNVDLASTLPEISANYKPLPVNHMNPIYQKPEKVDEAAALNQAMNNKNKRSKVYSGNKTGSGLTGVPSLYDLCIRVLIQNIDAIEDTGEVPYYILSPVLKQATAEQLYQVEHYNRYLIEDTDDLWKFHCNREFRNKEPGNNETWRDLYIRSLDEREAKLNKLTGKIKETVKVEEKKMKSTKLAYVDEFVKPPRNILKKQERYGTSTATSSSDMKKKLILTTGNNAPTDIAVPAPPMSRVKSSTSGIVKKGKAPLMAKALQLIKGRYKR